MPHGKKWTADECTVAAKAYVAATQDEINGADQTAADFSKRLNSFMKSFSPPACAGLTEEEKVNVAVASHLRKISVGETLYSYKNFDKISWRFYGAWHVLKDTEKVRAPQQSRLPSEEVASAVDAFDDNSTLSDSPVESPVDDVPVLSVSSKSSRRGIPDRLKEIAFENVEEEVQKSRREREGAPGLIPLPPPTAAEAHENDDISADSHGYEGTAAL
ncbi:hypothetical protein IV203_014855 [Nitzschia inconspicua]|uniref:Uncharacterized protein n=1 Tax=Nitzschia inconspicua TaxID=303405 RepID=A0A9K3LA43_9STRA|nr:hypothetical protein IV203_014855 [Nitzschia inconspicua]